MKLTKQCYGCKEQFRVDDLISYTGLNAKIAHNYCQKCLADKQARERFSTKICQIFGIQTPGPRIWTERKRLQAKYGYTDDAIIDCLEYVYNVEKARKLTESLALITPVTMDKMQRWRAQEKTRAGSIAAAIATTETTEYIVPMREFVNKEKRKLDPNDFLDD